MASLDESQSDDFGSAFALPSKIEAALRAAGVRPTPDARQLLRAAAQLGAFKESDRHILSASGLLFTAVELDRSQDQTDVPSVQESESNPEKDALKLVRRAFLGTRGELQKEFLSLTTSDFYKEEPQGWRDTPPVPNTQFSDRIAAGVKELQGRGKIDAIDLLVASLVSPGDFLRRRLERLQIDEVKLRASLVKLKVSSFSAQFRRERAGPLALGASQYALAVARLFRVAEAEFSLALLAPWGMGKTTIAREIKRYLVCGRNYSEAFRKEFGVEVESAGKLAEYETITFSAWTYRRQPELWIWLYESFVKAFLDRWVLIRVLRIFRCGIAKHGLTPIITSMAMMAFLAIPLTWIAAVIKGGLAIFGAGGLLTIILVGRRWFKPVRALFDRYGIIVSHRERLGLQALVGDDLRALVDAWARGGGPSTFHILAFVGFAIFVAGVWAFLMPSTEPLSSQLVNALCSHSSWCYDESTRLANAISSMWYPWGIWVAISAAVALALILPWGRVDRILLIVDDLDRCPPDEIVDLIDGLKLMLEEKKVGEHVQALVLADNRVLEQAIRRRFRGIVDETGDAQDARLRRVVREHMEKVFLCHFNLPPLTERNVFELAQSFAQEFEPSEGGPVVETPIEPIPDEPVPDVPRPNQTIASQDTSGRVPESSTTAETVLPIFDATLTFTTREKETIARVIEDQFGSNLREEAPTPRFIRSFLFKYQLARMILQMKRHSYTPYQIANGLARVLKSPIGIPADDDTESELTSVLQQVA
jgi:hypothetical protein